MSNHWRNAYDGRGVSRIAHEARALTLTLFLRCQAAAIGPMMALMMVPIAGAIAFGIEMGGWYYFQRSMQNAADSAAVAAATNASTTGSTYLNEARAAARPYGFVNGQNNTTVGAAVITCPAGVASGATCYEANVATVYPLTFSNVVGFTGSDAIGSGRGQKVSASAVAVAKGSSAEICVLSLSSSGVTFQSNGGPKPDMAGCNIMSNGDMTCNGHNLGASNGIAVGNNKGCGVTQVSGAAPIVDPYSARASRIPAFTCSDAPSDNTLNVTTLSGAVNYCGNVKLNKNITISAPNTVITVRNGTLDLNGNTLSTTGSGSATVLFSGTNSSSRSHYPTSSKNNAGVLDITAPATGDWSGVAIYQDPVLTKNVSFEYSGKAPTWNITGLVYFSKADLTFSGAVGKSGNGTSCFTMVAYTILVNGTANIFANNTQCSTSGLNTPKVTTGGGIIREKLVR